MTCYAVVMPTLAPCTGCIKADATESTFTLLSMRSMSLFTPHFCMRVKDAFLKNDLDLSGGAKGAFPPDLCNACLAYEDYSSQHSQLQGGGLAEDPSQGIQNTTLIVGAQRKKPTSFPFCAAGAEDGVMAFSRSETEDRRQ